VTTVDNRVEHGTLPPALSRQDLERIAQHSIDSGSVLNDHARQMAVLRLSREEAHETIRAYQEALGPALTYLLDEETVEIYKNPLDEHVWIIDGKGKRCKTDIVLPPRDVGLLIGTIAAANGLEITHHHPEMETVIPYNGSRFTAVVPPLCASPLFAIRKRISKKVTLQNYINDGTLDAAQFTALDNVVRAGKPIIVVGGQRTGKTTFVNAGLAYVAQLFPDVRFGIVEDTPEIQCPGKDRYELLTSRLHSINYQHLIKFSLRLGADSFTLGELREEPSALFDAYSTGTWATGFCTVHGDSIPQGVNRIRSMYRKEMGIDMDYDILADTIGAWVALTFVRETDKDGKVVKRRKVTQIARMVDATASGYTLTDDIDYLPLAA